MSKPTERPAENKKFKAEKIKFHVPIHDVLVVIVVTTDIPSAYKREFGVDIDDTRMACLGYRGRKFGLFFDPESKLRLEIVAHEVFHLTHRILEQNCMNFDESHHEIGAYLCEFLTKKVFSVIKKQKSERLKGGKR